MRGKLLVFFLCFAICRVGGQVLYGSLTGTIQDASGAAVPEAEVTIANASTGQSRRTVTNPSGIYSLL